MKGMQKIKRGTGFFGVLKYAFSNENARLIACNMTGFDAQTLSSEFAQTRALRQDIKKPVWHSSLRLTTGEKITDEQWSEIASDYMKTMGFNDSHLYCAIQHDDKEGQHIHIIASRIGLDKTLYYGRNENLESTRVIHELESKHNLVITKGRDEISKQSTSKRKKVSKNELEKAIRTGEAPARQVLQNALDQVMQAKNITVSAFLEQVQAAEILVKPAVASTGRLNGFSFSTDAHIWFKGSSLGKKYSLSSLIKDGLTYEQIRDGSAVIQATERALIASNPFRTADTTSDDRSSVSHGELERGISESDRDTKKRDESSDTSSIQATHVSPEEVAIRHEFVGDRDINSDSRTEAANQNFIEESHQKNDHNNIRTRLHHWRAFSDDLTDLASCAPASVMENKPLTKSHQAKIQAITKQLDSLDSPLYRLTLISRNPDKKSFNLGKSNNNAEERFFAKTDVISQIPTLSRLNAQKYDIYVTPIDNAHHYILIDDMTEKSYQSLLQRDFKPCLVQQSSADNFQAIIKIPRENLTKSEQSAANQLVQKLNQDFGDINLTGVIHPFRLAGFANKKQNRQSAFTTVILALNRFCSKSVQMLIDIRKSLKTENKHDYEHVEQSETKSAPKVNNKIDIEKLRKSTTNQVHLAIYEKLIKNAGTLQNLDLSVIDYRFCKILLKTHTKQEVMQSLASISHDLENRHKNAHDYIYRTVSSAENEMKNERQASNRKSLRR